MGGRGASLRNRNNSISKVRKGLGYVGKISTSNRAGLAEIPMTSTYERWRTNNKRNFDAWFGKR